MEVKGTPMTIREIYENITNAKLYEFHSDNPEHVVRSQIRRHCIGLDFPSSSQTKHFVLTIDNKYFFLKRPKKRKYIKKRIKKYDKSSTVNTYSLNELRDIHCTYVKSFRNKLIINLKKLNPPSFEIFSKRLLEAYGFVDVQVTQVSKDGGIDGFGKLKVGLAFLNVAFQSKRWTKSKIGRPEIDRFRGAIQGQYEQGIFFTTSYFAPGAENISFKPGAVPIILIDGNAIVDMMLEKSFGVQTDNLPIYSYALDLILNEEDTGGRVLLHVTN